MNKMLLVAVLSLLLAPTHTYGQEVDNQTIEIPSIDEADAPINYKKPPGIGDYDKPTPVPGPDAETRYSQSASKNERGTTIQIPLDKVVALCGDQDGC